MTHGRSETPRHSTPELPGLRTRRLGQLTLVALLLFPPPMWAATITVNDGGNAVDAVDNVCTLPEAVKAANTNTESGDLGLYPDECDAGDSDGTATDEIVLTTDVALSAAYGAGTGGDIGMPIVSSQMIVKSSDPGTERIIERDHPLEAAPYFRLFEVNPSGDLAMERVQLTGGSIASSGGAIANFGTVTLTNSTVTANAGTFGGGIYTNDTATLTNTTVSDNAGASGGGLYVYDGMASLYNSTVSGNSSDTVGGGIGGYYGSTLLVNTTISANKADLDGGGMYVGVYGTALLINSTLSGNAADYDGDDDGDGNAISVGYFSPEMLTYGSPEDKALPEVPTGFAALVNTVIAHHPPTPPVDIPNSGGDFSCVGEPPDTAIATFDEDGSCTFIGPSAINDWVDESLEPNGGPTQTHALLCVPGNGAYNGAGDCVDDYDADLLGVDLAFDQRGFPRVGACDVGAYELQGADAPGLLFPIALSQETVDSVGFGMPTNIFNGDQPGNFGWLTWAGDPSVPVLAASLTWPGNSDTYVNPYDPTDSIVSVDDWVQGSPGVSNARDIRNLLDDLIDRGANGQTILVPVWDEVEEQGNNANYQVAAFAEVIIIDYKLPRDNMITAIIVGLTDAGCSPN